MRCFIIVSAVNSGSCVCVSAHSSSGASLGRTAQMSLSCVCILPNSHSGRLLNRSRRSRRDNRTPGGIHCGRLRPAGVVATDYGHVTRIGDGSVPASTAQDADRGHCFIAAMRALRAGRSSYHFRGLSKNLCHIDIHDVESDVCSHCSGTISIRVISAVLPRLRTRIDGVVRRSDVFFIAGSSALSVCCALSNAAPATCDGHCSKPFTMARGIAVSCVLHGKKCEHSPCCEFSG